MYHLMESRVNKAEEERYDDDKENEMKNDWMLAAAVLDRLCAIAITVFFVAGCLVFFILFAKHPWLLFHEQQLQFSFKNNFHILFMLCIRKL